VRARALQFEFESALEREQVVEAAPAVSFGTSEDDDVDAEGAADFAVAVPPGTIGQNLLVGGSHVATAPA